MAVSGLALEIGVVGWLAGTALLAEVAGRAAVASQGWAFVAYLGLALVALLAVLRGVWLARPWSKAPAVTLQLLVLLAGGVPLLTSGHLAAGAALSVLAVGVGFAVLAGVPRRRHGPWDAPADPATDSAPDPAH